MSEEKKSKLTWAAEHLLAPIVVGVLIFISQAIMTKEKAEELSGAIKIVADRIETIENKNTVQGEGNPIANVSGDRNTTTQVGNMNINPKEDIRQDPPEISLLTKRINEGEALRQEFSKCEYKDKEIEELEKRANVWLNATANELGQISETAKQLFLAQPQLPMQTIRSGCSDVAFSMRRRTEVYLYNLRNVLPRLTGKR